MDSGEARSTGENAYGLRMKARRAARGGPRVLARMGALEVRLATRAAEIRAAQKLRYRVFFEEGGALAAPIVRLIRRDVCHFDRVCDHLIVLDNSAKELDEAPVVVGAYRLLRQAVAEAHFGFYSAREFQVGALIARHPGKRFLELGRSCVADAYRGRRALELLWRGIWVYARQHRIDAMFGCASFPGADPNLHVHALQFLRGERAGEPAWSVDAIDAIAAGETPAAEPPLDPRTALRALPPLIKGYWRLGAQFSRQAVVDPRFRTTDVLAVLPMEAIEERYLDHFARREETGPLAA
jgi:L-ornithine Nalpha-acyltransferase